MIKDREERQKVEAERALAEKKAEEARKKQLKNQEEERMAMVTQGIHDML